VIRDRSLIALLVGEFVSRLGSLATLNFVVAVGPIRDHAAQAA
jgi:hypothetical protein